MCVSERGVLSSVENAAMFTSLLPMICACLGPVTAADPLVLIYTHTHTDRQTHYIATTLPLWHAVV